MNSASQPGRPHHLPIRDAELPAHRRRPARGIRRLRRSTDARRGCPVRRRCAATRRTGASPHGSSSPNSPMRRYPSGPAYDAERFLQVARVRVGSSATALSERHVQRLHTIERRHGRPRRQRPGDPRNARLRRSAAARPRRPRAWSSWSASPRRDDRPRHGSRRRRECRGDENGADRRDRPMGVPARCLTPKGRSNWPVTYAPIPGG